MAKETLEKFERPNSEKKEDILRKLDIKDEIDKVNNNNDSLKEMMEKHNNNKEVSSSIQIICRKLEIDLQKEKEFFETKHKKTKRYNRDKRRSNESKRRDRTRTYRYYSTRQSERND